MATLSQAEQRAAIDGLLQFSNRDAPTAATVLAYIETVLPTFPWETTLRQRAALWQPFIDSHLSISAWCDEVIRLVGTMAA